MSKKKDGGEARKREQGQRREAFEKITNRSSFSPSLRAKLNRIRLWAQQGKNEDQIVALLGSGTNREEFRRFCQAKGVEVTNKRKSSSSGLGTWNQGKS